MATAALLVAAGSGERLGADRPKAFVVLAGRPMLEWSLAAIRAAGVERVVVAVPPEVAVGRPGASVGGPGASPPEPATPGVALPGVGAPVGAAGLAGVEVVAGGTTRSESVRNALAAAGPDVGRVVVHDAARPLVRPELFVRCLAALDAADAAIAAAPVADTVKEAGPDRVVLRTLDRSRLWAIQTPQAFRREVLERALDVPEAVLARATDDAWLVERAGGRVLVVESTPENSKVTTPHDLQIAEFLLSARAAGAA